MKQIPEAELIEGRWYVGRGRNANVALWCRVGKPGKLTFCTIGFTFRNPVIKDEGYWMDERVIGHAPEKTLISYGCFQPFMLIDEGIVVQPVGTEPGWDSYYAVEMKFANEEHRRCV